jgi:hypothetical protein
LRQIASFSHRRSLPYVRLPPGKTPGVFFWEAVAAMRRVREKMDKATREKSFEETNRIAKEIITALARAKTEKSERLLRTRVEAQQADAARKPPSHLVERA